MAEVLDEGPVDAVEGEAHHDAGKPPAAGGKPAPGDKSDKRKTTLLVVASVLGVIIAFITYRKMGANSAAAASTLPTPPAGAVVGDAGTNPNDTLAEFEQMLTNYGGQIANLQNSVNALSNPSIPTNPAVPKPPPAKAPAAPIKATPLTGFVNSIKNLVVKDKSNGGLFEIVNGKAVHLTGAQATMLANNPHASVAKSGGLIRNSNTGEISEFVDTGTAGQLTHLSGPQYAARKGAPVSSYAGAKSGNYGVPNPGAK